jgi:hypothetical protein
MPREVREEVVVSRLGEVGGRGEEEGGEGWLGGMDKEKEKRGREKREGRASGPATWWVRAQGREGIRERERRKKKETDLHLSVQRIVPLVLAR